MSSNTTKQDLKNTSSEALDWTLIQKDMKNKLGSDIYLIRHYLYHICFNHQIIINISYTI